MTAIGRGTRRVDGSKYVDRGPKPRSKSVRSESLISEIESVERAMFYKDARPRLSLGGLSNSTNRGSGPHQASRDFFYIYLY